MKKIQWLPATLIAGMCAFTACSDEKEGDVFSQLTPDQHKIELEEEGISFVNKMNAIADLNTYDVIDQFVSLMDQPNTEEVNPVVAVGIDQINTLRQEPKTTVGLKSLTQEGDESFSAGWTNEAGIYEWIDGTWQRTAATEEITYKFEVNGQTAAISASNFSVKTAANQTEVGFVIELPQSLKISISLNDTELCTYTFTGEWYENDTPKLLEEIFYLEGFNAKATFDLRDKSHLKNSASFDYKNDVIVANGFAVKGNIDYDAIFDQLEAMETEGEEMPTSQNIINNANAWFQIGNIKADALINIKAMQESLESKAENINWEEEDAFDKLMIELLNENTKVYVRYANSNEIFAKGEFYLDEDEDTYWNGSEYVTEIYTEPNMRMLFPDGSAINADFFNNGFGDMITEINQLIQEINTNYLTELGEVK